MKIILAFATLLAFSAVSTAQTIRFVRSGADPDAANGYSWDTAFPDLNDALAGAQYGDEIWVAEGTYLPTGGGNRYLSFTLPNGVRLYGGFAGTETSRLERDWTAHPTILSGDIGTPGLADDNSYGILYAAQCDTTTTVDGLIFENGNADNPDDVGVFSHERTQSGGAIYLYGMGGGKFAYLTISNCVFRNNHSDYYGSVYANGRDNGHCAVRMNNCEFYQNHAGYAGGGLVVENYYGPQYATTISHSSFHDNVAQVHGGALYLVHHGDVQLRDCSFFRDSILYSAGGAIGIKGSDVTGTVLFEDCSFDSNKLGNAGSAGSVMTVEVQNPDMEMTFRRCVFARNKGADGIFVPSIFGNLAMQFEQCIFRENLTNFLVYNLTEGLSATYGFDNCLFYNNAGREFFNSGNDVFRVSNSIFIQNDNAQELANPAIISIDHSLVSNADCTTLGANVACGPGMLYGADPQFADPASGDFHLLPCSPALDAGDDAAALAAGLSKDFDGHARFADAAVDLGPFENDRYLLATTLQPASCAGVADGSVAFAVNACAPYELIWTNEAGQSGSNTNGLQAGTYHFRLNDPNGFADSVTLTLGSPPPLVIFTTVVPASGPDHADGSVVVDSAFGGTPPYSWTDGEPINGLSNLLPGTYTITLTDSWGCAVPMVFEVGFVSATSETAGGVRVQLSPNPTAAGHSAALVFEPGQIGEVRLLDARGREISAWQDPAGTRLDVQEILPAGVYFFEIRDKKGGTTAITWLIR